MLRQYLGRNQHALLVKPTFSDDALSFRKQVRQNTAVANGDRRFVICDPKGEIVISGRSLPENALEIFDPLFLWIDEYVKNAPDKTIINCELEYVNSSSNRHIHTAFKKFEPLVDAGKTVEVNWTYEEGDEDTYDLGADYNDFLKVTFNFIEK